MWSYFQRYLQIADYHHEALDGDARQCYFRPAGYCRERTEWICHLLAYDSLAAARISSSSGRALANLGDASYFERAVVRTRPQGFDLAGGIDSSCQVLKGIVSELQRLGKATTEIDSVLGRLLVRRHGLC